MSNTVKDVGKPTPASQLNETPTPVNIPDPEHQPVKKLSARKQFHSLIMNNPPDGLTDLEILQTVGKTFNWTENDINRRKHYTKWYRSELRSLGFNPPNPVKR